MKLKQDSYGIKFLNQVGGELLYFLPTFVFNI